MLNCNVIPPLRGDIAFFMQRPNEQHHLNKCYNSSTPNQLLPVL